MAPSDITAVVSKQPDNKLPTFFCKIHKFINGQFKTFRVTTWKWTWMTVILYISSIKGCWFNFNLKEAIHCLYMYMMYINPYHNHGIKIRKFSLSSSSEIYTLSSSFLCYGKKFFLKTFFFLLKLRYFRWDICDL